MPTECNQEPFQFHPLIRRAVRGRFDGGAITSDAGGLLLREVEKRTGILRQFAACFRDHRDPARIEHTVAELVAQRVYGLALGYEDLNDHEELRRDPLLAVLVEKADPQGEERRRERDQGQALAGKSTLNRLELTGAEVKEDERYKKIALDEAAVDQMFVAVFLAAHREAPPAIILDLDSTDDPLHGQQEGRFFHGYYGHYCYLPLYLFCGEHLLGARLRPSNIDPAAGSQQALEGIVKQIRQAWPQVRIIVRGDSGFGREEWMAWCEEQGIDYVLGLANNERLKAEIISALAQAEEQYRQTGRAARVFKEFSSQTRESWSRAASRRQSRTLGEKFEPPLRCDLARGGGLARSGLIRTALRRARRDGEPHQGTTHAIRRPHLDRLPAQQPDSALLLLRGLLADARPAATGTARDGTGPGAVRHDSSEAAEDRRAHPGYGPKSLDLAGGRLSLRRSVPVGLCAVASPPLTVLKKARGSLRWSRENSHRRKWAHFYR